MSSFIALAIAASPAAAHDGTAVITVESQTVEDMSVSYVMRAEWDNDGHAAADATATVVAESPAGERVGPVAMEPSDDDGRYAATLEFPAAGDWNVRFTVVTPPGTLEIPQTVTATNPASRTEPTEDPDDPATSAVAADDTTASTTAEGSKLAATAQEEGRRPTSTAASALFFFIVAVIILGACLVAYRSRGARQARPPARRPRPADTAGTASDTPDTIDSADDGGAADDAADEPVDTQGQTTE